MIRRAAAVRRRTALPRVAPALATGPLLATALAATTLAATAAGAQAPRARGDVGGVAPVARLDVSAGSATAVHGAGGVAIPVGTYLRLEAAAGGGVEIDDGETRGSARGELLARFVLDPFRERGRGVHVGGGLAWWSRDPRVVLVAVVGVEGAPRSGWTPSLEVGLGRGARVGVVLRRR